MADIQVVGKKNRWKIALKIYVRRIMIFGGRFLTVELFMPSLPGDLFSFRFY